jgi:probable O-glycosylation ligase (exosortase A-associated)
MKGLVFTYVLTYGGAAASLFNPFVGLLVYVCFAIVKPEAMWHWVVPEGNYSRIVAAALLAGWALNGFGSWRLGRAGGVVAALAAFWLWSVASAAHASNPGLAWKYVEELAKVLLPFLVGITTITSRRQLKQLAWVIMLSQAYVAFELNLSYVEGFNRVAEAGFAGLDNNSVAIAMNCSVGLAFFLGLSARHWWQKALAFGSALLMAHVILFTFSRGGMMGLIITGMVTFLLIPKRPVYYFGVALASAAVLYLAGPEVRGRFASSFEDEEKRDWSANSRLELWANCLDVIGQNPLLGVGPSHFGEVAPQYGWERGKEAHTLWLQTGAELGAPGLAFLVSFYGLCGVRLLRVRRMPADPADPWPREMAAMVLAPLAGFAVSAQFVSLIGLEAPYYVALLGAGVLKLTSTPPMDHPALAPPPLGESADTAAGMPLQVYHG